MGVQGNRLSQGFATRGLLDFDYSDFRKVKEWAGLTMGELKEAIRMATEETAAWATKSPPRTWPRNCASLIQRCANASR